MVVPETLCDVGPNGSTETFHLGEYDSNVEDSQCPSKRGKGSGSVVAPKTPAGKENLPLPEIKEDAPAPSRPSALNDESPPAKRAKTHHFATPSRSGSSLSFTPPSSRKPKHSRSKSPTYWKLFSCNMYM